MLCVRCLAMGSLFESPAPRQFSSARLSAPRGPLQALEVLDVTLRGIELGEIGAVEAVDALLTEELTTRENRRVRMAVQMARLSAIKTLAGFDFAFQGEAVISRRFNMLDVVDQRRQRAFVRGDEAPLQLFSVETGIGPHDGDGRPQIFFNF
jgi:IstB-like ATP binding protein